MPYDDDDDDTNAKPVNIAPIAVKVIWAILGVSMMVMALVWYTVFVLDHTTCTDGENPQCTFSLSFSKTISIKN